MNYYEYKPGTISMGGAIMSLEIEKERHKNQYRVLTIYSMDDLNINIVGERPATQDIIIE